MGIMGAVVVGLILLWRLVTVHTARAQVEATRLGLESAAAAIAALERNFGTAEQARREGRLIEYYESVATALKRSDDDVKWELDKRENALYRRALIVEALTRAQPCRFLEPGDFESLRVPYPGPEPIPEPICDEPCSGAFECTFLPQDAASCPFCDGPVEKDEPTAIQVAEWRQANEAWDLWKRYRPREAAREEAEWRSWRELTETKHRAELESAVAAHRSRGR